MYEARAVVSDNAGNQATGSAYSNGAPVVFAGSLREQTKVSAAFSGACPAKHKTKRHAKRHAKRAAVVAKRHRAHRKHKTHAACGAHRRPKRHAKRHAKRAASAARRHGHGHKKKAAPKKRRLHDRSGSSRSASAPASRAR